MTWRVRQWACSVGDGEDEIVLTRGIVWTARYYHGWDSIEGRVADTPRDALADLRVGLVERQGWRETGWHRVDLDAFDRAVREAEHIELEIGGRR